MFGQKVLQNYKFWMRSHLLLSQVVVYEIWVLIVSNTIEGHCQYLFMSSGNSTFF